MSLNHFQLTWPDKQIYRINYIPPEPGEDEPPENPDDIPDVPPSNPVVGQSIISGNWSNPATWHNGVIPTSSHRAIISTTHVVTYDLTTTTVAGIWIQGNGKLNYRTSASSTLNTTENVVVNGVLELKPPSHSIVMSMIWLNINESLFQGGGMDVLPSDKGLWVMGNGKLDIVGSTKKPWTNTTGTVNVGATSYTVQDATGWQIGDEIVIVPMDTPGRDTADWNDSTFEFTDNYRPKFERRIITGISGNTVSFTGGLSYSHPQVTSSVTSASLGVSSTRTWNPEVINLSRNVRFMGTKDAGNDDWHKFHRMHVFIRSTVPQNIRYLQIRYSGPRKIGGRHSSRPDLVSGRYGLHFHHCGFGSTDSTVYGCSIFDSGNRMYVPHVSHGINMSWNTGFNSMQEGMWWDHQEITHYATWEDNLMACITQNGLDSNSRAFLIQIGDGNIARRNVAVYGTSGDHNGGGAYAWDADSEGVWIFENNMAHSSRTGLFVWQNTSFNHTIINYDSFNCYQGIFHGAYINSYIYRGGHHYKSLHDVKATSGNTTGVLFEKVFFDAGGQDFAVRVHDSPVPNNAYTTNKWVECVFRNCAVACVRMFASLDDSNEEKKYKVGAIIKSDVASINPILMDSSTNYDYPGYNLGNGNEMYFQPISGQSYKWSRINQQDIKTNISAFAPTVYGVGYGLMGEYYLGSNFNSYQFSRIDSMIMFVQWSVDKRMSPFGVHHLIQGDSYSMRWTGKIQPQFNETYFFRIEGAGGYRLWINNVLILDSWFEKSENTAFADSSSIPMLVGTYYNIKIEHFNSSGQRGCMLYWKCPSLPVISNVPQSQMYHI